MSKNKNRKSSRTTVVLLVLALIAVVGLAMGYYFAVYKPAKKENEVVGGKREAAAIAGSLQYMSEEEIQEAIKNTIKEGMFRICINSQIFAHEDGSMEIGIQNHYSNKYLMQVTLYTPILDEVTGEKVVDEQTGQVQYDEIYRTDVIEPGYYIQYDVLDKPLPVGKYEGLGVFTALYPDTGEIVGTSAAEVELFVFENNVVIVTPTPEPTPEPTAEPTAEVTGNP